MEKKEEVLELFGDGRVGERATLEWLTGVCWGIFLPEGSVRRL